MAIAPPGVHGGGTPATRRGPTHRAPNTRRGSHTESGRPVLGQWRIGTWASSARHDDEEEDHVEDQGGRGNHGQCEHRAAHGSEIRHHPIPPPPTLGPPPLDGHTNTPAA